MTKADLISAVAAKTGATKKSTEEVISSFVEVVTETLKAGDKVSIVGFGTFEVRERAARDGVNPQTQEKIRIESTKIPAFKAGKTLKDAITG
jgi:DNA-binding protein HU-beta